jgi:hypothetical protein
MLAKQLACLTAAQCLQGGQLGSQTGQQDMGMGTAAGAAGAATAGAAATRDRSDRREDKAALKEVVRLRTVKSNKYVACSSTEAVLSLLQTKYLFVPKQTLHSHAIGDCRQAP